MARVGSTFRHKGPEHSGRKVLISLRLDSATTRDEGTVLKGNSHSTLIRTSNDKEIDQDVYVPAEIPFTLLKLPSLCLEYLFCG